MSPMRPSAQTPGSTVRRVPARRRPAVCWWRPGFAGMSYWILGRAGWAYERSCYVKETSGPSLARAQALRRWWESTKYTKKRTLFHFVYCHAAITCQNGLTRPNIDELMQTG